MQQDPATRTITVGAATDGTVVSMAGTTGDRRISGVATGVALTDAVNVGQLTTAIDNSTSNVPLRANNTSALPSPVASGADGLSGGFGSTAAGKNATSYGTSSAASGEGATAVGSNSAAGGVGAVALGQSARANQANAVAIGSGVTTNRANQVAVGTSANTYTLAGLSSSASTAAQRGPTRFVVSDSAGNLALSSFDTGAVEALVGQVAGLQSQIDNLNTMIGGAWIMAEKARRESRQGTAAALALASAPFPSAPGKTSYSINGSTFRSEYAFGISLAHRLDTVNPVALTGGVTFAVGGQVGARLGIEGEF